MKIRWAQARAGSIPAARTIWTSRDRRGTLQGYESQIQDLDVGEVESVELSKDLKHILVTLQMDDAVEPLLTEGTRFRIVGGNFSLSDLSAVKAIVSGPYIEMDPGPGKAQRRFVGLDRPPPVPGNTDGTRLVLHARRLGSISPRAPLDYLGLRVGAVEDDKLVDDGRRFDIDVFVRAPYDKLVHRDTRFWDAGAARIAMGSQSVSAELTAPEALLSGAISFETPPELAAGPPAKPDDAFALYRDRDRARGAPIGQRVAHLVRFRGAVGNLSVGAAVELRGFRVGEVVDVSLGYDAISGSLETPVTIELEPARLKLDGVAAPADGDWTGRMNRALERMIQQGLRARLDRSTPVIGGAQVTPAFVPSAPPATLGTAGPHPEYRRHRRAISAGSPPRRARS
jgi:paraquat-inducible protein B